MIHRGGMLLGRFHEGGAWRKTMKDGRASQRAETGVRMAVYVVEGHE